MPMIHNEPEAWELVAEHFAGLEDYYPFLCNQIQYQLASRIGTDTRDAMLARIARHLGVTESIFASAYGNDGDVEEYDGEDKEARLMAALMFAHEARDEELRDDLN